MDMKSCWSLIVFLMAAVALGEPSPTPLPLDSQGGDEEVKVIRGKERQLTIPLGVSRTIEFPFKIGPIIQTDEGLFNYQRVRDGAENKLLLTPKNSGTTDFTVFDQQGQPRITYIVRVTREDMGNVIAQLEDLLGDIEGLKVRTLAGTIILDGEILLPRDMIRIMRVLDAVKDRDPKKKEVPIRNLCTISKLTMNILAERIEREIGSPEITARVVNNTVFLEGTAEGEFEADRAVEIARTYLPEVFVEKARGEGGEIKPKQSGGIAGGVPVIIDLLRVRPRQASPPSQDIKVTMNYVELDNEYGKSFEFSWKPLVNDQGNVKYDTAIGELTASLVATVSSLIPKLSNARDHGHARILKQQTLIVKDRSDAPAFIDNTLNLYVRVTDDKGNATFQLVPVKNLTKVRAASIPGSDSIELGVQIELSAPLAAGGGGPPAVASNSLQTMVTVKNGESAALAGSAIDQALAGYNRAPGTNQGQAQAGGNQGSPLFNFSRSKSFSRKKNQYIIFITPEIIRTASAATEDMTRKFRLNSGER